MPLHLGRRVARQQAEIDRDFGFRSQYVGRVAAPGHGDGGGGAYQGIGGRVAFERAEQRTLQQPAVSDRGALGDSHRAADPIEESYDRSCQEGGHSFLVEHLDDLGRQYERSLLRRHRGVTSGAPDRDSDRAESLFGRSYEGSRTLDSSQPGGDDDAAFVIDGVESEALFFEIAGDLQGTLRAAGFLVESEGDPHVPLRAESSASSESVASRIENSMPFMSSVPRP